MNILMTNYTIILVATLSYFVYGMVFWFLIINGFKLQKAGIPKGPLAGDLDHAIHQWNTRLRPLTDDERKRLNALQQLRNEASYITTT